MSEGKKTIKDEAIFQACTIDNALDELNFNEIAKKTISDMIFAECENMRKKLARRLTHYPRKYGSYGDILRCADSRFTTNVFDRTVTKMTIKHVRGKKYNVKSIIKKAIKAEWMANFGK